MSAETERRLALLEQGHVEAQQAFVDLRAKWHEEDLATARARQLLWAKHEQGAKDRDAMRVRLGGKSLIEAHAAKSGTEPAGGVEAKGNA